MKIAREIGAYKKDNNMTILQTERWKEVLQKFIERGCQNGLSEEFITRIIKSIHDESIEQQESVMTSEWAVFLLILKLYKFAWKLQKLWQIYQA